MLGGPQASPHEWLWAVYAAATPVLRRQALGLVHPAALVVRGAVGDFPGLCNLTGYYLLAHDAAGPYLIGYSRLFTFYSLRALPPKFVYHELVRAARWLRQNADLAGAEPNGRALPQGSARGHAASKTSTYAVPPETKRE